MASIPPTKCVQTLAPAALPKHLKLMKWFIIYEVGLIVFVMLNYIYILKPILNLESKNFERLD